MRARKILVMGLPGAGKTTLAFALARALDAVHFNADRVRAELYGGALGFAPADRVEHARRMGWLCDRVVEAGHFAVADFVCPTGEARRAFGDDAIVVWVDRVSACAYADTNQLFEPPATCDVRITAGTVDDSVRAVLGRLAS